jgi:hypothetical protein
LIDCCVDLSNHRVESNKVLWIQRCSEFGFISYGSYT